MRIAFNNNLTFNRFSLPQYSRRVSFSGFECSEDNFEVKNLHNIPCPICSTPMVLRGQINAFSQEVEGKCGEKLIKTLSKNNYYFHELQKKTVQMLCEEAQNYPYLELSGLAEKIYIQTKNSFFRQQSMKFTDIINMLGRLDSVSKEKIEILSEKHKPNFQEDKQVDTKLFLNDLNRILGSAGSSSKKKIIRTAKKMPCEDAELLDFLKKIKDKSSSDIAIDLLEPSLATTEHLKTKQEGGENNSANYVAQCKYCNEYRGHKKLKQWLCNFPDFVKTANLYMNSVAGSIKKGELSNKYDDYLTDICRTIFEETQGTIELEPPEAINGNDVLDDWKILSQLVVKIAKSKKDFREQIEEATSLREIIKSDIQFQNIEKYLANTSNDKYKNMILSAQRPDDKSKNAEFLFDVDFPSEIEARIAELEQELNDVDEIEEKIASKRIHIAQKDDLIADMRKNEIEIAELILDNQKIDTSNNTNEGLIRYRELVSYLQRIDVIEASYFKSCFKKVKEEDRNIFNYSRQKLLEEAQDLALNNSIVHYNINLDKIETATKNLRVLNHKIEQITALEKELEKLNELLCSKNSKEQIKSELEVLSDKKKLAQKRFSSFGVESQINDLKQKLKQTEVICEKLKTKPITITRKEYMDLCEEYGLKPFVES